MDPSSSSLLTYSSHSEISSRSGRGWQNRSFHVDLKTRQEKTDNSGYFQRLPVGESVLNIITRVSDTRILLASLQFRLGSQVQYLALVTERWAKLLVTPALVSDPTLEVEWDLVWGEERRGEERRGRPKTDLVTVTGSIAVRSHVKSLPQHVVPTHAVLKEGPTLSRVPGWNRRWSQCWQETTVTTADNSHLQSRCWIHKTGQRHTLEQLVVLNIIKRLTTHTCSFFLLRLRQHQLRWEVSQSRLCKARQKGCKCKVNIQ